MKYLIDTLPIKFYHLDVQDCVSLPALVNLLFEASGKHAAANGFGLDLIREKNVSWIVSRIGIYFEKLILKSSNLKVETWIDRTIGPSTLRKFKVYSEADELLATACFSYAALNLETRQPVNVKEILGKDIADLERGKSIPIPAKVRPLKDTAKKEITSFLIKYSDLDYNQHVTTSRYIQWLVDVFSFEQYQNNYVKSIDVNFASELFYGDKVSVYAGLISEDCSGVEIQSDEKLACSAKIKLANR